MSQLKRAGKVRIIEKSIVSRLIFLVCQDRENEMIE